MRDQAHENAYAKALETLGVDWKKTLPIPKTNAERFPEVKATVDKGLQSVNCSFDLTGLSEASKILRGPSPSHDGTDLSVPRQAPEGGEPITVAPPRHEEYAPGVDAELLELIAATAELEVADIEGSFGPLDLDLTADEKSTARS